MRHLGVACFSLLTFSVLAFGQNTQSPEAQRPNQQTKTQYFIESVEICALDAYKPPAYKASSSPERVPRTATKQFSAMFRPLRDSGFFFDVSMNVLDSPRNRKGKIVAFSLREKPIIRRIVYKGINSIAESDITFAFSNEKVGLSVGTWFDQNELAQGAAVIKELLVARGCSSATVKPTSETSFSTNVVTVQFEVIEGPKSP